MKVIWVFSRMRPSCGPQSGAILGDGATHKITRKINRLTSSYWDAKTSGAWLLRDLIAAKCGRLQNGEETKKRPPNGGRSNVLAFA
jgi:hypothetical protein